MDATYGGTVAKDKIRARRRAFGHAAETNVSVTALYMLSLNCGDTVGSLGSFCVSIMVSGTVNI